MSSARIDSIDIELVYSQELEFDLIGSEARGSKGDFISNVDAVKRRWLLLTRPMLKTDRNALINYLESVFYGPVDFWLDEFGANTVPAFVTVEESRGISLPNRRSLSITIDEE